MVNHPNRRKVLKASAAVVADHDHDHDHDYSGLLSAVAANFAAHTGPFFTTDAANLWKVYLDAMPAERQVHDCHSCKKFVENFGGLVAINEDGAAVSVVWSVGSGVPEFYVPVFDALSRAVSRSRVIGQFLAKEKVWGIPKTGTWTHIAVTPAASSVYRERALTPFQAMAAIKENYRTVSVALSEITAPMLDEALHLLSADQLARSEKFIGPVKWLRQLHERPKGKIGENILWRAISLAPEGYCHPRASVISPLLEDIAAGLPYADIKARFDAKMHPLQYQRPQAAPAAGAVAAAEAIVAKLGIGPSLDRRFARSDEVQALWRPRAPAPSTQPTGGVFAHVKTKTDAGVRPVNIPAVSITWEKFKRTVLSDAAEIKFSVPSRGNFLALLTAATADAPPILKWDRDEARNPVSGYVYHGGSGADQWRLSGGSWVKVTAVCSHPSLWGDKPMTFLGDRAIFLLDGCADTRTNSGNALFPEYLKDELHGIRSTIEAYSRTAEIGGRDEASACGYDIGKGNTNCTVRVKSDIGWTTYRIDRWD